MNIVWNSDRRHRPFSWRRVVALDDSGDQIIWGTTSDDDQIIWGATLTDPDPR